MFRWVSGNMEIKNEIVKRIEMYGGEYTFTPLKINVEIISPLYINSPWLHLDSILSYLCVRDALDELFYYLPTEKIIDISKLKIPLKRTEDIYHSSVGIYSDNLRLYRDKLYKRFTDKQTYKLTRKQQKGKIKINQGHYKDFLINMPMLITDNITFYANGNKKEIKKLLSHLTNLGKKTSIGGGQITNIKITETNEDYSFFKDNNVMRPIPVKMKLPIIEGMRFEKQPYKPPYWDKNNVSMCYVPKNQILEVIKNA